MGSFENHVRLSAMGVAFEFTILGIEFRDDVSQECIGCANPKVLCPNTAIHSGTSSASRAKAREGRHRERKLLPNCATFYADLRFDRSDPIRVTAEYRRGA